jgi:NIMA-interacting peptidyl-prolyl cis-trans isomerase 4
MGKNNAKGAADKKGKGKEKAGDSSKDGDKSKGLKPATSINVRHILVRCLLPIRFLVSAKFL